MLQYCLKCKKDMENGDSKVLKTKNGRAMLSSKLVVWSSKKSRFLKEQEANGYSKCSLGIKTPLSNISLLGKILF